MIYFAVMFFSIVFFSDKFFATAFFAVEIFAVYVAFISHSKRTMLFCSAVYFSVFWCFILMFGVFLR